MAPRFLDALVPQFLLPLESNGRQHSVPRVFALRIVEHLDGVEHVLSGVLAGAVCPPPDPLALEQVEEALGDRIVMAVPTAAHRVLETVGTQERGPVDTGKLAALVGVDQHLRLRLSALDGHKQGLQDEIGRLARLHRSRCPAAVCLQTARGGREHAGRRDR